MERRASRVSRGALLLLTTSLLAAGLLLPASAGATAVPGTTSTYDFPDTVVGTTSAPVAVTVPLVVHIADIPSETVLYGGGDALVDYVLALYGLPVPLTAGDLATAYPDLTATYTIDSAALDSGTDFHLDPGDCIGASGLSASTCSASATFQPTLLGPRTDILRVLVSSIAVTGAGLASELATAVAPLMLGTIGSQLTFGLAGQGVGPKAISRSPVPNATGVPRDARVTITFSEPMDATTITASTLRVKDLTAAAFVAGSVTYDAVKRRATFAPAAPLAAGHEFRAYGLTGIQDLFGNAFGGTIWSFTVTSDATAPAIASRKPAPGAAGVGRLANVYVTFDEPLRASTVTTSTVRLRDTVSGTYVSATVTYSAATRMIALNPGVTLAALRTYRVYLFSAIRDLAGNQLSPTSWTFTTGS